MSPDNRKIYGALVGGAVMVYAGALSCGSEQGPRPDGPSLDDSGAGEPACGDYSVPLAGFEAPWSIEWHDTAVFINLDNGDGASFGMTGPIKSGGALILDEGCILAEPPTHETNMPDECRQFPPHGRISLSYSQDVENYDIDSETVFSQAVEEEMTYVLIVKSASETACVTFGHDTCIYQGMECSQPYGYAGNSR